MKKMKQQVMKSPGHIEFREVPIPDLKENEILVKIMRIGICGSDVHVYHGKHPNTSYPVTQGHEASAKIIKTGSNVRKLKPGDKITYVDTDSGVLIKPAKTDMISDFGFLKNRKKPADIQKIRKAVRKKIAKKVL